MAAPAAAAPATTTDAPVSTTAATPADPAASAAPQTEAAPVVPAAEKPAEAPLFTIPDTVKLAPEVVSKHEAFLKSHIKDGKLELTGQDITDHFLGLASGANEQWQTQIKNTDATNKAECEKRFSPVQLGMAETAVGFFSSFDPGFRDLAKRQLNDPVFVNAMRIVGERLSEDTLEVSGGAPPPPAKRSAAERLYGKKPN